MNPMSDRPEHCSSTSSAMAARWFPHALASVGEGMCPDHGVTLEPGPKGGWCPTCESWWWIDWELKQIVQTRTLDAGVHDHVLHTPECGSLGVTSGRSAGSSEHPPGGQTGTTPRRQR